MPATTAEAIIAGAFGTIGVYAPGETIAPADITDGFRRLNLMMASLSLQPLTKPVQARQVFDLEADKGGPDDPYTIGDGGDFDVTRPTALAGASIMLVQSDPSQNVEVPVAVITDSAWQAIQIKQLTSTQFTDVYFDPTFDDDLATINLWPVPNVATNKLVLYWLVALQRFATLTTEYYLPDGCEEALEYQLAKRLLLVYPTTDAETKALVREMASDTLANFKRANTKLIDLATDPALTKSRAGGYNILTGTGGGA